MTTHATLSPSARGRWGNCPGSVRLIAALNLVERESSPAAKDGTHSHTLLEYCVKNFKSPNDCIGEVFTDHDGQFTVTKERADRVNVALSYISMRMAELGLDTKHVYAETRVSPATLVGRDDMDGTIDVQLSSPAFVELIDFKDGMHPVEAVGNLQLEQYAVGVIAQRLTAGIYTTQNIRLTIIQPKLMIRGIEPVSSWDLSVDELFNRLPDLINQAAATDDPNAPLVPGETQCLYCPGAGSCGAYAKFSLGEAGMKFGPVDSKDLFEKVIIRDDEVMTDDKLREIIFAAPMLRKLIENAEAEALRRISSGQPITGLKAIMSPGRRMWAQDEESTAEKLKKMGVPKDAIWEHKLVSPVTVIDKLMWKNRAGEEHRLSAKQIALLEKEFVKKSEGKLSVVPADDKRPAVDFGDVAKMFAPAQPEQAPQPEQIPSWLT